MIWAQWTIVGIAVLGAVVLVVLGIRLWRLVKRFSAQLTHASATFAEMSAGLQAAQAATASAAAARSGTEPHTAYTRGKSE